MTYKKRFLNLKSSKSLTVVSNLSSEIKLQFKINFKNGF